MTLTIAQIAIRSGDILLPLARKGEAPQDFGRALLARPDVVTVISNMAYQGYALNVEGVHTLLSADREEIMSWWAETEPALRNETFDDRNMGEFVVYKNFPAEVIAMDDLDYWTRQILMYVGLPNDLFTQEEAKRAPKHEETQLRVLKGVNAVDRGSYHDAAYIALRDKTKSWTDPETETMKSLVDLMIDIGGVKINISDFPFRMNGVALAAFARTMDGVKIEARDATDALRFAQAISADKPAKPTSVFVYRATPPLESKEKRTPKATMKIGTLSRPDRRMIIGMLEAAPHLAGDVARRPADFKALMKRLRPGEFTAPKTQAVYDDLYAGRIKPAQADVENAVKSGNVSQAFRSAEDLPAGVRLRRFRSLYALDAVQAVNMAIRALPDLDTGTVLGFIGQVKAMNEATYRIATPKGNWSKMKVFFNAGVAIDDAHVAVLQLAVQDLVGGRLASSFPHGVKRNDDFDRLAEIKLPENGQAFASYGRGTTFPLPQEPGFVRTASYWENESRRNTWFDNGIILMNDAFTKGEAVCWNSRHHQSKQGVVATFSGDPTNSKDLKGRACQMVDLYPDNRKDWRYAVWNILCFSHVKFADATGEVLGTLQIGADPQSGNLYEPSRALFKFKLERDAMTSYVAVADMAENRLVYLDADLGGHVSSAADNVERALEKIPAVLDVLSFRPSWHDLLSILPQSPKGVPVGYGDAGMQAEKALCFAPEDQEASYEMMKIQDLLITKGGGYSWDHAIEASFSPSM